MNRRGSMELSLETLGKLIFYAIILLMTAAMVYAIIQLFVAGEKHYRAESNFKLLTDRVEYVQGNKACYPDNSVIIDMPEDYMVIGFSAGQERLESRNITWYEDLWRLFVGSTRIGSISTPRPERHFFGLLGEDCKKDRACICLVNTKPTIYYFVTEATTVTNLVDPKMKLVVDPRRVGEAQVDFSIDKCVTLDAKEVGGTQEKALIEAGSKKVDFSLSESRKLKLPDIPVYDLVLSTQDGPRNVYIVVQGGDANGLVFVPYEVAPVSDYSLPKFGSGAPPAVERYACFGMTPKGGGFGGPGGTGTY